MYYVAVEKEALDVKWAVETLQYYLYNYIFVPVTDHMLLQWLERVTTTNS